MTNRTDVGRGRDIVARWCALAEQRLEYLAELFETGRWRRYHSELAFLENIQEAKRAVELWRDLLTREACRNNSAIDVAPPGRTQAAPSGRDGWRDQVVWLQPRPAQIPSEPPCAPAMDDEAELTLDTVTMQQHHPLLRNAL